MDLNDLSNNPDQIKNLINLLQSLLDSQQQPEVTKEEEPKEDFEFNKNIKTRGSQKRSSKNKYVNKFDKMSESSMHKDDIKIDKALSKHPPVSRMREFEMVDVICRICGKKDNINPSLLFDSASRYKCNNCSTQSG